MKLYGYTTSLSFLFVTKLLIISSLSICEAQTSKTGVYRPKAMKFSSISFGIGSSHYYGDISTINPLKASITSIRWNISLGYQFFISNKLQLGFVAGFVRLAGDDFYSDNDKNFLRNLHFRNDIKQISTFLQYHPLNYSSDIRKRLDFSPFLTMGLGYFIHNPKAKLPIKMGAEWVELPPLHTEGQSLNPIYPEPYKLSGWIIPIGIGVRYRYNKKIDFSFEMAYHFTFTDYLDDVSGFFPNTILFTDPKSAALSNRSQELISVSTGNDRSDRMLKYFTHNGLPNPVLGATGTDRGSQNGNDSYLLTSVKVHILIPKVYLKCPKFK